MAGSGHLRIGRGQGEGEGAAAPDLALHPDAAAVVLDDLLADGKAQARALGLVGEGVAHLLEALEDLGLIGRTDSHSRVGHADHDLAAAPLGPAGDRARVGELHGVGDQVDHHLDQAVGIAGDAGQIRADPLLEVEALRLEERRGGGGGAIDDLAHVDGFHVPLELARLDLREVEHVVDELGQPLALAHHHLQVVFDLLDGLGDLPVVLRHEREDAVLEALLDDLGEAQHRGEGRPQLVAHRGEERALGRVGLLGHAPRALRLLEQPADLPLVLVELAVGVGVVEGDGGVGGQALQDVQVMLGVRVLLEALDGDDAQDLVLGDEGEVDERLRRLRHGAVFEKLALLLVLADVAVVFRGQVVDEDGLAVLHAPDRQLVAIGGVARVGRVALALLDGQAVFDLVPLRVVEAHPEHVGVGELVDPLVELPEDRVEVEGRGDLAADLAQELDVLLAFAFRAGQGLGRLGAQPGFGELRPFALLGHHAAPLQTVHPGHRHGEKGQTGGVGPPGAVPRRQDGEGIDGLVAYRTRYAARLHPEAVVPESQVGVVAPRLASPRRPLALQPVEPGLVLGDRLVDVGGRGKLQPQGIGGGVEPRRVGLRTASEDQPVVVHGDPSDQRLRGRRRRRRCAGRVEPKEAPIDAPEPRDAVVIRVEAARPRTEPGKSASVERPRAVGPFLGHDHALAELDVDPAVFARGEPEPGLQGIDSQRPERLVPDEAAAGLVEPGHVGLLGSDEEQGRPQDVGDEAASRRQAFGHA